MKTDEELAARALRHRAEEAIALAERMEAAPDDYVAAPTALREEAAACIRVATRLSPEGSYNHHGQGQHRGWLHARCVRVRGKKWAKFRHIR